MSVNKEIEQLIDDQIAKMSKTIKEKLIKIVLKNDKNIIRQYVALQKDSAKNTRHKNDTVSKHPITAPKKKRTNNKLHSRSDRGYSSLSESDYSSE
jgi:uncharacterized protein YllA (UPF0747 family)